MAPVQGGAHGALPRREVAGTGLEGGVEAVEQRRRVEQPGACGSELEGEREAGQPLAGGGDGGRVCWARSPIRGSPAGPGPAAAGRRATATRREGRARPAARRRTRSRRAPAGGPGWSPARSGPAPPRPGPPRPGPHPRRCSALSSTSSRSCPRSRSTRSSATGRPGSRTAPTASAMAGSTWSASSSGASSTSRTPSAYRSCTAAAAARTRRVLPTPPGPLSVTSRLVRSRSATRATSSSRPMRGVAGAGSPARRPGRDGVGGRACCPGRHRCQQGRALVLVEVQRHGERAQGVRVGAGAGAALEGADRVRAQAGLRRELLLGQARGLPEAAQHRAEPARPIDPHRTSPDALLRECSDEPAGVARERGTGNGQAKRPPDDRGPLRSCDVGAVGQAQRSVDAVKVSSRSPV